MSINTKEIISVEGEFWSISKQILTYSPYAQIAWVGISSPSPDPPKYGQIVTIFIPQIEIYEYFWKICKYFKSKHKKCGNSYQIYQKFSEQHYSKYLNSFDPKNAKKVNSKNFRGKILLQERHLHIHLLKYAILLSLYRNDFFCVF